MVSPRKGRTTMCCVILLMHTIIMVEVARNLVSRITATLSSPLLHESSRRGLRETNSFRAPTMSKGEEKVQRSNNDFLDRFEDTLTNNPTSASASTSNFAALILKQGKIYCRKSQIKNLSRSRYFVQMLRQGFKQQQQHIAPSGVVSQSGFPILIKHDDSNGCYPDTQTDKYGFPRLTWSIPVGNATNHARNIRQSKQSPWCSAIGMPPYKTWRDIKGRDGDAKGADYEEHYPWKTKLSKAVWRGASTCNKGMYGHLPIEDIPRSKLVQSSLKRPDLIDAGYHKFVGKYQDVGKEDESRRRMHKESITLEDMMKYKAIIDIDGNNWSARFSTLLCMNSVIIKIQPDFVEQYYHNLEPNVHYVPASLDNITQVVEYVVDKDNDLQMKAIVKNANQWCQRSREGTSLAQNAISTLGEYRNALDEYYAGGHWIKTWNKRMTLNGIDDLVECKV